MDIKDLQELYKHSPQVIGLKKTLENKEIRTVFLKGLMASAMPITIASLHDAKARHFFIIMPDEDEAGYVYNDYVPY